MTTGHNSELGCQGPKALANTSLMQMVTEGHRYRHRLLCGTSSSTSVLYFVSLTLIELFSEQFLL